MAKEQIEGLQEHLQRAAATAGTDATAASAIGQIDEYQSRFVGTDRRNSGRPLRASIDRLTLTESQLDIARSAHRDFLRLQEERERLQGSVELATFSLQLALAARARRLAQDSSLRFSRARDLTSRCAAEPEDPAELREKVQEATTAVGVWENRPSVVRNILPTSGELIAEIGSLPDAPDGDTRPHPDAIDAEFAYRNASRTLADHQANTPLEPRYLETGGLTPHEIKDLANEIVLEEPEVDPDVDARVQRARHNLEAILQAKTTRNRGKAPFILLPLIILLRLLGAIIRQFFGSHELMRNYEVEYRASEELRAAVEAQGSINYRLDEIRKRRRKAERIALETGLPVSRDALLDLAAAAEDMIAQRQEMDRWQDRAQRLGEIRRESGEALRRALISRGSVADDDLLHSFKNYGEQCEERDIQASLAARRPELKQALDEKRGQESAAADALLRRREATRRVQGIASRLNILADTDEGLMDRLRHWVTSAQQRISEMEEARHEWRELRELLDGQQLGDLQLFAERRTREAETAAIGIDEDSIGLADQSQDLEAEIEQHHRQLSGAQADLSQKHGQFEEFARTMPNVAEAEEELEKANTQLAHVRSLDKTLSKTRELLVGSQDRVHRSLAPRLRDVLKPWVNAVTNGRYDDVRVDVETLEIKLAGGGGFPRSAGLLSHGTTEQVYLLLRVAMTRFLTKKGETCPLILDDVTVHCDPDRQAAILDLLHVISKEQQVILFSQEPETLAWAETHLSDQDHLVLLDPGIVPA